MEEFLNLQTSFSRRFSLQTGAVFLVLQRSLATPILQARNATANESATTVEFERGWNAGPSSRGTLTLIFSCVITLFLCVWTTVQVNIEPEDITNTTLSRLFGVRVDRQQSRDPWVKKLQDFLAKRWVRKLGWSCVTIIVPEATLAVAMYERRTAIQLSKAMTKTLEHTDGGAGAKTETKKEDRWSITLAYYTIMGGFSITVPNDRPARQVASKDDTIEVVSTKQVDEAPKNETGSTDVNGRFTLTPQGVLLIQKKGLLPVIRPEHVMDKSKANKLTKVIVFFQALWMIVQVISRTAARLPVTLLELHTCVHTFCALFTYATWWDKPVDVDLSTPVPVDFETLRELNRDEGLPADEDIAQLSPLGKSEEPVRYLTSRAGLGKLLFIDLFGDGRKEGGLAQGYFYMLKRGYRRLRQGWRGLWREALAISFVGIVYGLLHLAVWQNEFPTTGEQILWRVAAVITAVAWSGFLLSIWVGGKTFSGIYAILFGLCVFPCLGIRLFLLFESFFSLRKLPVGSYEVPIWSQIWPHVG